MAEGGDLSGLVGDLEATGAVYVENPAGGLLAPGESATAERAFILTAIIRDSSGVFAIPY